MPVNWKGREVFQRIRRAQIAAIDATMAAAILHAKANHLPGAHGAQRFESQTGELERSIRITEPARKRAKGAGGRWGSKGLIYARRLELGFQGKDRRGAIVDAPAFPFLRPAAEAEHPKLASRVKRALA